MNWGDFVYYDETSPSGLRWKVQRGRYMEGSVAGSSKHHRYWSVRVGKTGMAAHRIIYEIQHGVKLRDDEVVDHIDGNTFNNKISNLRAVPRNINLRNMRKDFSSASGITGVTYDDTRSPYTAYWVASWVGLEGEREFRIFSVKDFGDEMAFLLACGTRYLAISDLNAQGAGYTEDHGMLRPKALALPVSKRQSIVIDGVVYEQRVPEGAYVDSKEE